MRVGDEAAWTPDSHWGSKGIFGGCQARVGLDSGSAVVSAVMETALEGHLLHAGGFLGLLVSYGQTAFPF